MMRLRSGEQSPAQTAVLAVLVVIGIASCRADRVDDGVLRVNGYSVTCCLTGANCYLFAGGDPRWDVCAALASAHMQVGQYKRSRFYLKEAANHTARAAEMQADIAEKTGDSEAAATWRRTACAIDIMHRADCPGHDEEVARRERKRQADAAARAVRDRLEAAEAAERERRDEAASKARWENIWNVVGAVAVTGLKLAVAVGNEYVAQQAQQRAAGVATMDRPYPVSGGGGGGGVATGGACPNSCPANPVGIRAAYEAAACSCRAAMANPKACCKAGSQISVCLAQLKQCVDDNTRNAQGMGSR